MNTVALNQRYTSRVVHLNAVLEEIRKEDGAQKYRTGPGEYDIVWITGWPRASNVRVGDKGQIVYKTSPTWGLNFFEKV